MKRGLAARDVRLAALAHAAFLFAGCAHGPATPATNKVELDPIVITAGKGHDELDARTDGQLFDDGAVYFRSQKYAEAARHFDKLVTAHPSSPQLLPALYNAGLAHQRLGHFQEALDRFLELLRRDPQGRDATDAQFQAALCEYRIGKKQEAGDRLHALGQRTDLSPQRRAEALVQEGVCRFETGQRAEGEQLFRGSVKLLEEASVRDAVEPGLLAQAEFWLGETYRAHFLEARLDPATMDQEKLGEAIENKAQFLMSAQGHYLRAIRKNDGEWATAAGYRVGELYEAFHDELVKAPLPRGLDPDQASLYRLELRGKVKVLMGKAIQIYEQTLAAAQRTGASNDYVAKARLALERVRKLLAEDDLSL